MTRKEEIKQKALSKYPQGTNRYNKFIEGAEWANKTMIEKACEWIKKEVLDDYQGVIWDNIVEDFRKALEE